MIKRAEVEDAFGHADALPILEEVATVGTRVVVTGRLRVSTRTDTLTETACAVLDGQDVEVGRVPVGTPVDAAPPVRTAATSPSFPSSKGFSSPRSGSSWRRACTSGGARPGT